jgi:flagellar basal-body rod protein FlgG
MMDSLYIAATGMHAQQTNVETISNNLANLNTTAFKRGRVNFEDLMYREVARARGPLGNNADVLRNGAGVSLAGSSKSFAQGDFKKTDQSFDLAIRGSGLFEVSMPDGTHAYTRNGSFHVDHDGFLANAEGNLLNPAIQIPPDATSVTIEEGGRVLAQLPNEKTPTEVGRIDVATFINPDALKPLGESLYVPTELSGDASSVIPGEQGAGVVQQGFLEGSNVKLVEEFVNLIVAQRAYEINAKAVQASDEMLSIANNLHR